MNNRFLVVMIVVLSGSLLLVGGGLIGAVLYLQGRLPIASASAFPTASVSNALLTPEAAAAKVGEPAPDFTASTVDGKPVKLSDFHGKPVMVNFWASWCGPCTAEMKNIESVYEQHPGGDFVILGVNQGENDDTIKGYGELWKLSFPLLHDDGNTAEKLFKIQALPTTVFVDAAGKVSEVHIGGPMTVDFIETRVKDLLAKVK